MSAKEIKIGMFGGGGVGKTCITLRYLKGEFTEGYIPTIEDEFSKVVEINNQTISLIVIDTAGQDDFTEIRFNYYRQVQGFVFVFDISNPQSIEDLKTIYEDVKTTLDDEVKCVVAANKADLRDEGKSDLVSTDDYKSIETELKTKIFETSAKTNLNIDDLFAYIVKQLLNKDKQEAKSPEKKQSTPKQNSESGGGCCLIA